MSNWPLFAATSLEAVGVTAASSLGISLTPGTSGSKSSWVEITSSLPQSCDGLLMLLGGSGQAGRFLFDLGIGAAGSEVVVVPDLLFGRAAITAAVNQQVFVPISLPKGTRVAIRAAQSSATGAAISAQIVPIYSGALTPRYPARLLGYQPDTTNLRATVVANGGSPANNKSSWVELIASCPVDTSVALFVCNAVSGNTGTTNFLWDIGIGASTAEVAILQNISHRHSTNADQFSVPTCLPMHIPKGSRVSVRCQADSSTVANRQVGITLYVG